MEETDFWAIFHRPVVQFWFLKSFTLLAGEAEKDTTESDQETFKDLPLKAERTLEFNTKEGTWLSVDISPDGQTIIFDMLGDLYTMPFTGGKATRITDGTGL